MCEEKKPNIRDAFNNLSGPDPIGKKLFFMIMNNLTKILTLKNCCGHPGEPGC